MGVVMNELSNEKYKAYIKRIIPCLDVKDGKVVKGVHFVDFKDVGEPVEYARAYESQGADEIVILDITATVEGRGTMLDMVNRVAKVLTIPFTVGGGVRSIEDFARLIDEGASKVSINSAAVKDPLLIKEVADRFGSKRTVLAIDGKRVGPNKYNVFTRGGQIDTGLDVIKWAQRCEKLGAGEILLTSMDADGTKEGFDLKMLNAVCSAVKIPVIASGGCGTLEHILELFEKTDSDAALAASVFHFGKLTIGQVKKALWDLGVPVNRYKAIEKYFRKGSLIPAIIQEKETDEVLMLAYMNEESLLKTLETGYTWFYSRSRNELWNKGATSGHFQKVIDIVPDCDNDTLLIKVIQTGAACHTGNKSCFYQLPLSKF